jgi:hypothetical protein
LEAQSTAESEIRDSCIQTFLSGIIVILCVLFVSGLQTTIKKEKKKRCNDEEVMGSYERGNGFFKKWPKKI